MENKELLKVGPVVDIKPQYGPDIKSRVRKKVNGLTRPLRLAWQWRRLKVAIGKAADAAQGHEANGELPGSMAFRILYKEVEDKMIDYSLASDVSVGTILARAPAITALGNLAYPVEDKSSSFKFGKVTLVGLVVGFMLMLAVVLGTLLGLLHGMAHIIAHLFGA